MDKKTKWILGIAAVVALFYFGVFDSFLEKTALNSVKHLGTFAVQDIEGQPCDENTACGGCWAESGIGYIYCDGATETAQGQCNIDFCVDVTSEKQWVEEKLPEYKKWILIVGIVFIFGVIVFGKTGRKFKFAG